MKNTKTRDISKYIGILIFLLVGTMFMGGCNTKTSKEDKITPTPVKEDKIELTNGEDNLEQEDETKIDTEQEGVQEGTQDGTVETIGQDKEKVTQNITYTMELYTKAPNEASTISIMYPVFSGDDIEWLNEMVLKKVEGFATLDTTVFEPDTGIHIDYKSEVTYLNDKIVSMIFYGYNFVDGAAHPMDYLFPLNVDLVTRKEIKLEDLYEVNNEFKEVFYTKSYYPENPSTSYTKETYSEMLALQTEEYSMIDPFDVEGNVTFFLKDKGLVLSMSAIHATGSDHLEGELSYKDISKFYKNETDYVNQP